MIKLYGVAMSRASRSLWALEEVGAEYENVQVNFAGDTKKPEYLKINPNGRIPALVDGDVTLFESMAINLYLAQRYGGDLWPSSLGDQARTVQWSVWGMTEIEPHLMQMVLNKVMLPEDQRDSAKVAEAEEAIQRPLAVLDQALADRDYLVVDRFSIADLNLASVLSMSAFVRFDLSNHANVKRWSDACLARPSFQRARKK